jgi:hypothetical protein
MFGRRKTPDTPFVQGADCKIMAADPTVSIPWSEVERDHWQVVCECGTENV